MSNKRFACYLLAVAVLACLLWCYGRVADIDYDDILRGKDLRIAALEQLHADCMGTHNEYFSKWIVIEGTDMSGNVQYDVLSVIVGQGPVKGRVFKTITSESVFDQ